MSVFLISSVPAISSLQGDFLSSFKTMSHKVPVVAQWLTNLTSIHEDAGLTPGLDQWVKDLALLWLWYRLAAATPSGPLAGNLHMP